MGCGAGLLYVVHGFLVAVEEGGGAHEVNVAVVGTS